MTKVNSGKVTVIIPTYNHGRFVCDAVESALTQSFRNVEVIVIDDGSNDNTREVLLSYADRIKYVYQENKGLSAARNRGIEESSGEYIALLDADDMWLPHKLERQIDAFSKSVRIGIVSCGGYLVDVNGNVEKEFLRANKNDKVSILKELIFENSIWGGGSSVVVRAECFDTVGLFDESLRAAEDWDMWLRIAMKYEIHFVEQPLSKIRVMQGSMSSSSNAEKMLYNELLVLDKVFRDPLLTVYGKKSKVYGYRYLCAAREFFSFGNRSEARRYVLKSLATNPFYFMSRIKNIIFLIWVVSGINLFKARKYIYSLLGK